MVTKSPEFLRICYENRLPNNFVQFFYFIYSGLKLRQGVQLNFNVILFCLLIQTLDATLMLTALPHCLASCACFKFLKNNFATINDIIQIPKITLKIYFVIEQVFKGEYVIEKC
jgi:hypothetical protein